VAISTTSAVNATPSPKLRTQRSGPFRPARNFFITFLSTNMCVGCCPCFCCENCTILRKSQ
jgi:hypothetical protein